MPLANVQAPVGFLLFKNTGLMSVVRTIRPVAGNRNLPLFVGDAYTLDGAGDAFQAIGTEGSPGVINGIVEAIVLNPINASPQGPVSQDYLPPTEVGAIIGIEDRRAMFAVQSTSFNNPTQIGLVADLTNAVPGDVLLRQSRQGLDGASIGAGTQFRIVDVVDSVDQTIDGLQNFVNVVVQFA